MSDRLVYDPTDVSLVGTVVFRIPDPEDEFAALLRLRLSAAAWVAQGCPRELHLTMTAPRENQQA